MDKFRSGEVILLVQVKLLLGVVEMLPDDKHHQYRFSGSKEEIERLAEQYDARALLYADSWLNPSYLRVCGLLEQEPDPNLRMHHSD